MGEILASRVKDQRIIFTIAVDENEALELKGSIKKIHLFSLDMCNTDSGILEKGKDGRTKFFLMPTEHKSKSKNKPEIKSVQKISLNTKNIFIYLCEKSKDQPIL